MEPRCAAAIVLAGLAATLSLVQGAAGQADAASPKDPKVAAAMARAGCTYRAVAQLPPLTGNFHSDSPTLRSKVTWSTFPPSSGAHHNLWAVWGFYRRAVNPRKVVHNLEHGGVIVWWDAKASAATVNRLEAFYRQQPISMLGTPIAGLGKKVALTAWSGEPSRYYRNGYYGIGHVAICPRFNQAAFAAFRAAFRSVGPEGVPQRYNRPGMGP